MTGALSLIVTLVVMLLWAGIFMSIHQFIEEEWCACLECALLNGFVAVMTVLCGTLLAGISAGQWVFETLQ